MAKILLEEDLKRQLLIDRMKQREIKFIESIVQQKTQKKQQDKARRKELEEKLIKIK